MIGPCTLATVLVFPNCKQMIDHQPSKIVTKTFYTGSDKQHYQDMGITSTLWHNVTQSRSVTQTNVTSHHVIHSNNHHHHQYDKIVLSFLDSDFKNVLFELSNPDKSMIIFPKRVIEFHLFFIFDSNISPLEFNSVFHNFWSQFVRYDDFMQNLPTCAINVFLLNENFYFTFPSSKEFILLQ